jgi:hypothetical protein
MGPGYRICRLPRSAGRLVHAPRPPSTLICGSCGIQAQRPIRAAAHHCAVVVVLAVIFPAALVADLIATALGQGRVTAARACVQGRPVISRHILLSQVRLEPSRPPLDEFLVRQAGVIPWPTLYRSPIPSLIHPTNMALGDGNAHFCPRVGPIHGNARAAGVDQRSAAPAGRPRRQRGLEPARADADRLARSASG